MCCYTTLWNINVSKTSHNNKLQGSVATHFRCGGVVNNQIKKGLLLSLWMKFFRIGEYLAQLQSYQGIFRWIFFKSVKIWQKYGYESVAPLFGPPCNSSTCQSLHSLCLEHHENRSQAFPVIMLARVKRQTDSSDCSRSLSLLRMRLAVSRRQLTSLFAFKCAAIGTRTIGEIESRFAAGTTSKISKISVLDLWQWHCSRPFHSATFSRLACIYPALVEELNIVMRMPLSVCLSLRARISGTTFSNFKKFYVPVSEAVAVIRSSSGGSAIRYVVLILWMTSCSHVMARIE